MFLLAALGSSIPQANIKEICKSATVDSLPEDRANASKGCIGDETSAKDQLKKEWGRFNAADRSNCAETPGMKFSYVELLTCLEMQRGGQFGKPAGTPGSPGLTATPPSTTPSPPPPAVGGQKP
jgi:hypothetical protein